MSRISEERMEKALEQLKTISEEDYAKVKNLANIVRPLRSVLFKTPDDYGRRDGGISISNRMTAFPWKAGTSPLKAERATSSSSLIMLSRCVAQAFQDTLVSPGVCMTLSRSIS